MEHTKLKPGYKYVTTNPNLFTLSPNEEARVIKEDNEKRRVLRLLQVREAQRLASQKILAKNKLKREQAVEQIGEELKQESMLCAEYFKYVAPCAVCGADVCNQSHTSPCNLCLMNNL